ncbi:MAG: hypothetical protein F4X47_13405 [Gammaproteobacteria bacterium]|nr:hypothetical protein [Gammaproteobacteria bacterium]MYC53303.1 hypothetical protein [Gammaproteobacteria bacterium]
MDTARVEDTDLTHLPVSDDQVARAIDRDRSDAPEEHLIGAVDGTDGEHRLRGDGGEHGLAGRVGYDGDARRIDELGRGGNAFASISAGAKE